MIKQTYIVLQLFAKLIRRKKIDSCNILQQMLVAHKKYHIKLPNIILLFNQVKKFLEINASSIDSGGNRYRNNLFRYLPTN